MQASLARPVEGCHGGARLVWSPLKRRPLLLCPLKFRIRGLGKRIWWLPTRTYGCTKYFTPATTWVRARWTMVARVWWLNQGKKLDKAAQIRTTSAGTNIISRPRLHVTWERNFYCCNLGGFICSIVSVSYDRLIVESGLHPGASKRPQECLKFQGWEAATKS